MAAQVAASGSALSERKVEGIRLCQSYASVLNSKDLNLCSVHEPGTKKNIRSLDCYMCRTSILHIILQQEHLQNQYLEETEILTDKTKNKSIQKTNQVSKTSKSNFEKIQQIPEKVNSDQVKKMELKDENPANVSGNSINIEKEKHEHSKKQLKEEQTVQEESINVADNNDNHEFKMVISKGARRKEIRKQKQQLLEQQQEKQQLQGECSYQHSDNCHKTRASNGGSTAPRGRERKFYRKRGERHHKDNAGLPVHKVQDIKSQTVNQNQLSQTASKSVTVRSETPLPVVNVWTQKTVKVASTPVETPQTSKSALPAESESALPAESESALPAESESALPAESESTLTAESKSILSAKSVLIDDELNIAVKSKLTLGAIPKSAPAVASTSTAVASTSTAVASTSTAADSVQRRQQTATNNAVETSRIPRRRQRGRRREVLPQTDLSNNGDWPSLEDIQTSKQNEAKCLSFKNNDIPKTETEIKQFDVQKEDDKKKKKVNKWIPLDIPQNCMHEGTGLHIREERTERAQRGRSNTSYRGRRRTYFVPVESSTNIDCETRQYVENNGHVTYSMDTSSFDQDYYLKQSIRQQIEYYFCEENLSRDFYLRQQMDENGFLPLALIASFPRVKYLTLDLNLILAAVLESVILEVLEFTTGIYMLRTIYQPKKWPLQTSPNLVGRASICYQVSCTCSMMHVNSLGSPSYFNEFSS